MPRAAVGTTAATGAWATIRRGSTVAAWTRAAVAVGPGATGAWATIVAPGRSRAAVAIVSEVAFVPRTVLAIVGGCRQRDLGCGFSLGSGAAQQGSRSRENPGGLGAHA